MGYDDDECGFCYSNSGCNNTIDYKVDSCLLCCHLFLKGGFRGRMHDYLVINEGLEKCSICETENVPTIEIPSCDYCYQRFRKIVKHNCGCHENTNYLRNNWENEENNEENNEE